MNFLTKESKIYSIHVITTLQNLPEYAKFVNEVLANKTDAFIQLNGTYLVITTAPLQEIFDLIYKDKYKPEGFLFLMFDQTNNISKETFRGVLNQEKLRISDNLSSILKHFKKPEVKVEDLDSQIVVDSLLEKVHESGINSLSFEEQEMLKIHSSKVPVKNLKKD